MTHLKTIFKLFASAVAIVLFVIFESILYKSNIILFVMTIFFIFFLFSFYQKLDQWFDKTVIFFKGPSNLYLIEMAISWIEDYKKSLLDFSPLGEESQWYCLYETAHYRNELIRRKIVKV